MRKVLLLAAVAAAAGVLASSAAAEPASVGVVGCVFLHGGNVTVPAGSTVSFHFGWGARTAGLVDAFIRDVNITASVNGSPVADTASYWGDPVASVTTGGLNAYVSQWTYPTGITLAAGDTLTLDISAVLAHPITDGFTAAEGGGVASGDVLAGHDTCTVTGV